MKREFLTRLEKESERSRILTWWRHRRRRSNRNAKKRSEYLIRPAEVLRHHHTSSCALNSVEIRWIIKTIKQNNEPWTLTSEEVEILLRSEAVVVTRGDDAWTSLRSICSQPLTTQRARAPRSCCTDIAHEREPPVTHIPHELSQPKDNYIFCIIWTFLQKKKWTFKKN